MTKDKTKCQTKYCRNKRAKNRLICFKCFMRNWRAKDQLKAAFFNIRSNAQRRGHKFELTYLHFVDVVTRSGYLEYKGRTKFALHIDKKIDSLGYVDGNIQVLQNWQNVAKYHYGDGYKTVTYETIF